MDSTFLEVLAKKVFFSNKGYSSSTKGIEEGIKIHLLYAPLEDRIEHMKITSGNIHDVKEFRRMLKHVKDGEVIIFDKGYFKLKNFLLLWALQRYAITFITPMKKDIAYRIINTREISIPDTDLKIIDNTIRISSKQYLRLID